MAELGWLIVTRDRRIQDHRAEIDAVRMHGAKMINLASADAGTTWAQLEVFMSRWREIDAPQTKLALPSTSRIAQLGYARLI